MKTYKRKTVNQRFSLHDSRIIKIQKEEDDLVFFFDYGFVDIHEDRMVSHLSIKEGVTPYLYPLYIVYAHNVPSSSNSSGVTNTCPFSVELLGGLSV